MPKQCLMYKGECIDLTYVYSPEPNDFVSSLIRRCAIAIDIGADEGSVLQLCYDAGQSEPHARLTYAAAQLLRKSEKV